ncbi:MAG: alpha-L-fucosidase [Acidimicrobiales bacterium]
MPSGRFQSLPDTADAPGPFDASWPSLQRYEAPSWYADAKFGIFIHWGAYAVAGFGNEWYPRNMYRPGTPEYEHHRVTFGSHVDFGYKDLIDRFDASSFDPDEWAQIFRASGAQFVVPVAEHHDGLAMYDSALSDWTAAKKGPRRDIIGELAGAVRRQSMVFGISSHRAEHWWFYNGGMTFPSDVRDTRHAELYGPAQPEMLPPNEQFLDDWLARIYEIVDRYEPQLVWFDWWIEQPAFEPYLRRFAAFYYNRSAQWQRGVVINYKHRAFPDGAAVYDLERGQLDTISPRVWQCDTSVGKKSWGYVQDEDYKTVASLICDLADVVSKNGVLLLNVGPQPDGTIPLEQRDLLAGIGRWLERYGEAIYGTRPWLLYGEGPTRIVPGEFHDTERAAFCAEDIRFTTRKGILYAIVLGSCEGLPVRLRCLGSDIPLAAQSVEKVELLGRDKPLAWFVDRDALAVTVDDDAAYAGPFALRLTFRQ